MHLKATRVLVAILALLSLATAHAVNYTTQNFVFKATIAQDGTLHILEDVSLTFTQPQHGLIRKIPYRTMDATGKVRSVMLELVGVKQLIDSNWESADTAPSFDGGDWHLRIGSADRTFEGMARYQIEYKVSGALTPIDKTDAIGPRAELLWNPLGSWPTAVDHVSGEVSFPAPTKRKLIARILLGPKGTRHGIQIDQDDNVVGNRGLVRASFAESKLTFAALRPVEFGESLTFDLGLPKGTVEVSAPMIEQASPGGWVQRGSAGNQSPLRVPQSPFLAFLPLLALPVVYFATRKRWAPPEKPMVVRFDPPPGIDASTSGVIMDNRVDRRDIVAGIVSLAQKGALRMHHSAERGQGVDLELLGPSRKPLSDFESTLYQTLEPYGPLITPDSLKGTFGQSYQVLVNTLNAMAHADGYYDERGLSATTAGCLLTLFGMALGCAGIVFGGFLAAACLLATFVGGFWMTGKINPLTEKGMDARWQLKGLREFISRAHQRELNYMVEKTPDQALFENLLPFAVAFDLVKQWTQAFAGIELLPPDWYVGDSGYDPTSMLWTGILMSDLTDFGDTYGEAMAFTPTSYGTGDSFSGGDSGFGGGFGGGSDGGGFDGGFDAGGGGGGGGADSW